MWEKNKQRKQMELKEGAHLLSELLPVLSLHAQGDLKRDRAAQERTLG